MNIGKPSKVKLYMDGKEIGEATSQVVATATVERPIKPFGPYSFTCTINEEDNKILQWELSRPDRIRKYIKQLFRL